MDRDGVLQYVATDHLGTTSLVLDDLGSVVAESRHYPYGEERWRWPQEGTFPTEYRFTGQRSESGLGLIHMGARQYDYALGRWLSADALVPEPGNPQSFNRYAYVGNRPLHHTDPSGHMPCGAACPGDWTNWEFNPDAAYQGSYDPRQQAANRARAKQAASLVIDLGSVAGDVKGLIEVFTGRDLVTGEDLGNWRFAGLAGLVGLGEIRYLRNADEAGDALRLLFKVGDTVEATGQWHHLLPNKVMRALGEHPLLSGVFKRNDFLVRARDLASHRGYQAWHRAYDDEVVRWLGDPANAEATQKEFLEFLLGIYGRPDMLERFPGAVDLLNQALEALE
jgi:RHS repeat-associated protein